MLLPVWRSCILLEIDFFFLGNYSPVVSLFLCVWCWVNSGSTLSSQAPLSFIPPHPSCPLHTSSWYLHNMNSGTSCLCLYYYYYYSVMTCYTADRSHISAHAVLLSRLRSSWDGLAREHVDHDHRHRYQCHQLPSPSSFLFCRVAAEETKRLSVNRLFSSLLPPSSAPLCSPARALHHTQACGSCGSVLITLQFLLLHIVHEWKRERERKGWRKGSASLKKCVQSSVCVCASCSHLLFSLLSDLGLLVHSRDIF